MDFRTAAYAAEIRHRHSDGSWVPMERREAHDAAQLDPERAWNRGEVIYACPICDEQIAVVPRGEEGTGSSAPA